MSSTVAAASATGSALAYAAASVLQHRAAGRVGAAHGLHLSTLARFGTSPLWLAGAAAEIVALALHAVALSAGELAAVQPLLVSGLLFALPLSAAIERRRLGLTEWAWAGLLVAGLSAFLLAGHPAAGRTPPTPDQLSAFTVAGAALGAIATAVAARAAPSQKAALLGAVAGLGYGLTAALIKQITFVGTGAHPTQVLVSAPLYLLLGIGTAALVVSQVAYQSGPLAASLPALTMINPLVAVTVGVAVFHESLAHSAAALGMEVSGLAVMTVAVIRLGRRTPGPRCAVSQ